MIDVRKVVLYKALGNVARHKERAKVTASPKVVCKPNEGNVFPGTWPDCLDCHGQGYQDKHNPSLPCPTCQTRSAAINHSLSDLIEFDYYGRPKKSVPLFSMEGQERQSSWIDITWAELFSSTGVHGGTWPDCTSCKGLGQGRYEVSFDGHRADYDWRPCGTCQRKTRQFHIDQPNEKDDLVRNHTAELKEVQARHTAEIAELQARHQAELDALPY